MALIHPHPVREAAAANPPVAQHARNALRRLALDKLEPTPENYARAYRAETGAVMAPEPSPRALALVKRLAHRALDEEAPGRASQFCKSFDDGRWDQADALLNDVGADGPGLAGLIDRLVRSMERGSRNWTLAHKRESLQRVLQGSGADAQRLQQRLNPLLLQWESDPPSQASNPEALVAEDVGGAGPTPNAAEPVHAHAPAGSMQVAAAPTQSEPDGDAPASTAPAPAQPDWDRLLTEVLANLATALPRAEAAGQAAAVALEAIARRIQRDGATPELVDALAQHCQGSRGVLEHRHHFVDQLEALCRELAASLTELAEDGSWAQGQCEAMRTTLEAGITARGVKSVTELLRITRKGQHEMRLERLHSRDSLKSMLQGMLSELGELGVQTGRFQQSMGRYAGVIEKSDSLQSLTEVVRDMVEESRSAQVLVAAAHQRLNDEHAKACELAERVKALEGELQRLSGEATTDPLTQVANRRGLLRDFESDCARMQRQGGNLTVGLLDIDNFKRLNDELGHNAGDEALKSLAAAVKTGLRSFDTVARYGGEEFVVLLPDTTVPEGQQVLTRLQRILSAGLFEHDHKKVLVTFSAGVTSHRAGERIEQTLERADHALFEAKRTGKNRTCAA